MNNTFQRTKVGSGFLINDSDLNINTVFYPPNFDEESSLDIGNNDASKVGAIATAIVSGETKLFVYQGSDVWKSIVSGSIRKQIAPWTSDPTEKDEYRSHVVDGVEYLFRSNIDENVSESSYTNSDWRLIGISKRMLPLPWTSDPTPINAIRWKEIDAITYQFASTVEGNTSEPTLSSGGNAWTDLESNELSYPSWDSGTSYPIGTLVLYNNIVNNEVYRSKSTSTGHNPSTDISHTYWDFVGINPEIFVVGNTYPLYQIVLDEDDSFRNYVSNVANNNYPLDGQITGTWLLLGPKSYSPDEPLKFVNPTLPLVSEGIYSFSFNLPEGKSIIAIERLQDGVISRAVAVSQAITTPANNRNTVIEGFDNNAPQTITIKIQ